MPQAKQYTSKYTHRQDAGIFSSVFSPSIPMPTTRYSFEDFFSPQGSKKKVPCTLRFRFLITIIVLVGTYIWWFLYLHSAGNMCNYIGSSRPSEWDRHFRTQPSTFLVRFLPRDKVSK